MASQIKQLGVHLSLTQIAAEFSCARDTVNRRLDDAGVLASADGGFRLKDVLAAFAEASPVDPDKLRPFERKAFYQAEHEKLQLQAERGELVPRLEVEQEQARILKSIAVSLDTLPDRFERDVGANPAQVGKLETLLDEVRESLYSTLAEAGSAERPVSASA
jgi:hypothetical protein